MGFVAVAGRRVDAPGASTVRFPIYNVEKVRSAVCIALDELKATELASSAANGADLIAAGCAHERGLPLHIVLPFDVDEFERRSVTDRPGNWAALYHRIIAAAKEHGTLQILPGPPEDDYGYVAANRMILDSAVGKDSTASALIVWDGHSRGDSDVTAAFADEAGKRGMRIREVLTLP